MKGISCLLLLFFSCLIWPVQGSDRLEDQIYASLEQGKPKEALAILEKWKADHGEDNPQYWVAGGNIWFQIATTPTLEITPLSNGQYKAQVGEGPELIITDPKTGKEVGKITGGRPLVDESNAKKAISFLDEGVRRNPHRLDIFTGRAHLYRTMGDLNGELAALESIVRDPKPKNGKYEIGPGQLLRESIEEYKLDMLTAYAREHLEKQDRINDKAAKAVAELIIKEFPKYPQGYNFMGALASYEDNWQEAKKWILLALEKDSKDSLVIANLGNCYEHLGDERSAGEQYKRIIELNNDSDLVKAAKAKLAKLEKR